MSQNNITVEQLHRGGFTNYDSDSLANLSISTTKRDEKATFCSSVVCATLTPKNRRGVLVFVGEYLKYCPRCRSRSLYHDTILPKMAADFRRKRGQ